jgi:hypothetical protein
MPELACGVALRYVSMCKLAAAYYILCLSPIIVPCLTTPASDLCQNVNLAASPFCQKIFLPNSVLPSTFLLGSVCLAGSLACSKSCSRTLADKSLMMMTGFAFAGTFAANCDNCCSLTTSPCMQTLPSPGST